MSRAAGRKNSPRAPQVSPDTPEGREIGESVLQDPAGSPIPGLTGNIVNYETVRQRPATVQPNESFDEYRGMMAHGVPNDSETTNQRALHEQGPLLTDRYTEPELYQERLRPSPIPVYMTEPEGGSEVFLSASPRHITVPNNSSDPVRLAGRNPRRNRIGLLNEGPINIRFAQRPSDLVSGGGGLIGTAVTTYQWFETQDELYGSTTDAATASTMSIVEEFEREL